jgi:cobalamin-dependent methionine synthase I
MPRPSSRWPRDQAEAGADYIDVNAGIFVGKEPEYLRWLVETVQQATDKPCAIDSPDPSAIEAALSAAPGNAHDQLDQPGEGSL